MKSIPPEHRSIRVLASTSKYICNSFCYLQLQQLFHPLLPAFVLNIYMTTQNKITQTRLQPRSIEKYASKLQNFENMTIHRSGLRSDFAPIMQIIPFYPSQQDKVLSLPHKYPERYPESEYRIKKSERTCVSCYQIQSITNNDNLVL